MNMDDESQQSSAGVEAGKSDAIPAGEVDHPEPPARHGHKMVALSSAEHERLLAQAKQAEQALRQLADLDNTKKRLQREKEEATRYAAEQVIRELLPIIDSLDQALVAVDKQSDPDAVIRGVHLIYRQLLGLLEREGVTRISTVGESFDPHRHEAVAQVDTADHTVDGTIVEEVHVGYTMHGKVLRSAMVKVAKKAGPPSTVHSPQKEDNHEGNA